MPIKLPLFDGQCVCLTVCSQVKSTDDQILGLLKETRTLTASYDAAGKKAHVRVYTGHPGGRYLHVDCAASTYFGEERQSGASDSIEDVLELLSHFDGIAIKVGIRGVFELDLAELPERGIIRSLSREERTADIAIRLTGGRLSLTGAPIDRVDWSLRGEGRVRASIYGDKSELLDDGYLLRAREWAEKYLELFVKGHTENADV